MSTSLPAVVIPCKDDWRVLACLDSLRGETEAVVVLNGSPPGFARELATRTRGRPVQIESIPEANLSRALELGIRRAPRDRLVLMDSDCTFAPGTLTAFAEVFARGRPDREVYRGGVRFAPGRTPVSRAIAATRRQHTCGGLVAYKPPLGLSRSLAPRVGGYFFDPRMRWKEDSELDHRLRRAGVRVVPVDEGWIDHAALDLYTDLRSNFRYGEGAALARHVGLETTDLPRGARDFLRRGGLPAAGYGVVANGARRLGYWSMRARLAAGVDQPGPAPEPARDDVLAVSDPRASVGSG